MPRLRHNRTAGARREISYIGISQRDSALDAGPRQARARKAKRALLREAEALIQPDLQADWKARGERMSSIHRRWKLAGSAGEYDERLQKRFKKVVRRFYEQRDAHVARVQRERQAAHLSV